MLKTQNEKIIDRLNEQANDLTEQEKLYKQEICKLKLTTNIKHTKEDIIQYINLFIEKDMDTLEYKERLINIFINSIYVFDDYISIYFNWQDKNDKVDFETAQKHLISIKKEFAQKTDCSTI